MPDISTPIGPIPAAPASGSKTDVLLWVCTVLFFGFCVIGYLLWRQLQETRREAKLAQVKCEAENQKAWGECVERDKEIKSMYQGALADQEKTKVECTSALAKLGDAVHEQAAAVRYMADKMGDTLENVKCLGTGRHAVVRELGQKT
jgi:hypothetical protein